GCDKSRLYALALVRERRAREFSRRASRAFSRASFSVFATFPPAVGARGSSVERCSVVGPRAAWGSEGPAWAFFTQQSPFFSYICLRAAYATRWALPPSP